MHAAALFLLAIQCLTEDSVRGDARVVRETEYTLVKIAQPGLRGTRYRTVGDATVYSGEELDYPDGEHPVRLLRLYVHRGGEWWQLRERGRLPMVEDRASEPAVPVVVEHAAGMVAVTYTERWLGANTYGRTARTVLLDFRGRKPAVKLLVECTHGSGGGACTAPDRYRFPSRELDCDADLRCTSTETQWIDWTTRTATRTFDLLTGKTFPPERLGATTYGSGGSYAAAFGADRGVLAQRVVIDRIGPVTPVFALSKDSILLAGPTKHPRVAVRFFHLTPGEWREIAVVRLTDGGYPDDRSAPRGIDADHTPEGPQILFSAWNIEYNGEGRLVEVLAREGEARSLYWIMFDPNGRAQAIRLATDTPEFRHCDDQLYPPSFTSIGIPDSGLPAVVTATRSWRRRACEEERLEKHCGLVGRLGWNSSEGWQPALFDAPCSGPSPQPYVPVLDDDGTLGVNFARPGACAPSP